MKTSVLALDLATTTGWAWHAVGMPRPFFGAFRLPGGPADVGQPCDALERFLRKMFVDTRDRGMPITHWFFEAQHVDAKINIDTVYRLIGLGATVEKFAWQVKPKDQRKAWAYKVHISTWRSHFLGRGSGFKREKITKVVKGVEKVVSGNYLPGEDPKELAIQRCAEFGWHTDIADAAEACGILDYGLSQIGDAIHPRPWRDVLLMKSMER
jgi:hypothetical protein